MPRLYGETAVAMVVALFLSSYTIGNWDVAAEEPQPAGEAARARPQ